MGGEISMSTLAKLVEFRRLQRNRRLAAPDLERLRLAKLQAVVRHSAERVPFYRDLWRGACVGPGGVQSLAGLERFPIVTKGQLKKAGDTVLAEGLDRSACVPIRTSGTTGDVFEVLVTRDELRTRRLVEFRTLRQMGLRPEDRLVIVGPAKGRGPHWHERLGFYRTSVLTAELSADEHIERLKTLRPTVLWSYPDPLHAILHRLDYQLSRVVRPRMIITSGRYLLPGLKRRIEADLGCAMFNSYAAMETGRLAAECPQHRGCTSTRTR